MANLYPDKIKYLEVKANALRQSVVEMLTIAASGHTAGSLGMADIFSTLFFHSLKHNPDNPDWPERDRLILSNGHICPVYYAALAHAGYFPIAELKTLRRFGSRLQGHPHREFLPMVETSSGPLGSGLSQTIGMAIADKMDKGQSWGRFFFCLMSDAEQQCGNTWEGAMLAGKLGLGNLVAIIDRNNIQIDGFTEEVMPLEPLRGKYESFGWQVIEIDGHDFAEIDDAIDQAKAIFNRPTVIIAHTIPGKGVAEFERKFEWHGKPPSRVEGEKALAELRTLGGKIKSEHE